MFCVIVEQFERRVVLPFLVLRAFFHRSLVVHPLLDELDRLLLRDFLFLAEEFHAERLFSRWFTGLCSIRIRFLRRRIVRLLPGLSIRLFFGVLRALLRPVLRFVRRWFPGVLRLRGCALASALRLVITKEVVHQFRVHGQIGVFRHFSASPFKFFELRLALPRGQSVFPPSRYASTSALRFPCHSSLREIPPCAKGSDALSNGYGWPLFTCHSERSEESLP